MPAEVGCLFAGESNGMPELEKEKSWLILLPIRTDIPLQWLSSRLPGP